MQEYDIIIVGGGMVGSCLALGLAGLRNAAGQVPRIALLEARTPDWGRHPGFDARAIALAQGSQEALASLGLWSRLRITSYNVCYTKLLRAVGQG